MPATSNSPTRASSPAATVVGMPWSPAAGMKCGWISPIVVAPQIIMPPARYQNGRVRAAPKRARTASRAAPIRTGSRSSSAVPP